MGVGRGAWIALAMGVSLLIGACAGSEQKTGQPAAAEEPGAGTAPATAPEDLSEVPKSQVSDVIASLDALTTTGAASIARIVDVSGESRVALKAADTDTTVFFDPAVLVGEPGEEITLVLTNTGNHPHRFAVESLGIEVMLPYGSSGEEVTLTVPAAGDPPIVFACSTGGHDLGGMVGALVAA